MLILKYALNKKVDFVLFFNFPYLSINTYFSTIMIDLSIWRMSFRVVVVEWFVSVQSNFRKIGYNRNFLFPYGIFRIIIIVSL